MDDDEGMDYDPDNYEEYIQMDERDELNEELENLFFNADSSDNPIEAYQNVIDLETQNSDNKKFTFLSYKGMCKIYLESKSYDLFAQTFIKLIGICNKLKKIIYKVFL